MNTPEWLPTLVATNFRLLLDAGKLSEHEQDFFTDARLKKFWEKADGYLNRLENPEFLTGAAECIPGAFLAPLAFYGQTGTADRPTPKFRARERQKCADRLIAKAANLAGQLVQTLESIELTTHIFPCEMRLMTIVRKLVDDEKVNQVASYYDGVHTSDAIATLANALSEYPKTKPSNDWETGIFADVPGMASQKSTWVDWLAEAMENHRLLLRQHPGAFDLAEVDWVNLTNVLISNDISRGSVQSALRYLSD